jgi:long-subunit fatty acid transport protein
MKKNVVRFVPLVAIALFAASALGQKVGSTSLQFLKVMPVARATAMGEAYTVLASGAEAAFWNPAGIARVQGVEASFTYTDWIFDSRQAALSLATSMEGYGAIGLQFQFADVGEIPEAIWAPPYNEDIEYPGLTGNVFRPFAYCIGLSYAYQLTERFSTGGTVKLVHESLYNGSTVRVVSVLGDVTDAKTWTNGILFDFGILYDTGFHTVQLGASVQNFGANVVYAKEENASPMALRVGVAADLIGKDALLMPMEMMRLGVAFDLFQPNDYTQQGHIGLELSYAEMFALRLGYKANYDSERFTTGVGVRQTLGGTRFSIDYSYGALDYQLGQVHRISIGAGF